jgi:thiol-disulfide isomerase/thioredoxin
LAEFGVKSDFAVQASVPLRLIGTWTRYTDVFTGEPLEGYTEIHHRNGFVGGLGDIRVATHFGWRGLGFNGGITMGMSLPTGRVHENPYRLGDQGLPHQHIQLGTGTVDPIASLDIGRTFGPLSLALFINGQFPLYKGEQGLQAGISGTAGLSAASKFGLPGPLFRLALLTYGEWPERWDDHVPLEDGNQGRFDLYLGPGVTFDLGNDWTLSFDARVRLVGYTAGAQLTMPVVLSASIGTLFHLETDEEAEEAHGPGEEVADVADLVTQGEAAPLTPVPGKWTVLDFWAPWCEACKPLDAALKNRAKAWVKQLALRRVNIVDFDSPIAKQELPEVNLLPRIRVVDPSGKVAFEQSGPPEELLQKLDALLH